MLWLALLLAAVVGLSLGLLGGGGSILTVPIFVYVLGFSAKEAIAASLAVVGLTSVVSAGRHWRAGNVNLRVALLFGVLAMLGAFLGSHLAGLLSGAAQLVLFALVMLVAAVFMLRGRSTPTGGGNGAPAARSAALVAVAALGVGLLTGLVGIGGGFLIVPALVLLVGVPMKQAVGTSLVVIAMNAASGFAGYLGQVSVRWETLIAFTAVAIIGTLAGAALAQVVPQQTLRRSFALFLVVMGLFILYQNWMALLPL